jgi:N-acetylneuraminate synthase
VKLPTDKVCVIAEAGVNHNGQLELALKLVEAASKSGADYVKFQTFRAELLVTKKTAQAEYQTKNTGVVETQYEMLKRLELSKEAHFVLKKRAEECGIGFMSTPFDTESLRFLVEDLKVNRLKLSSGDLTNAQLLLAAGRAQLPLVLSTGMACLGEIEAALGFVAFGLLHKNKTPVGNEARVAYGSAEGQKALSQYVTLLHCTTAYPAPLETVNLRAMKTLSEAFGLPVGYSDHTQGLTVPCGAIALGATLIEKHFTLDKSMEGPDHLASLSVEELQEMVTAIRQMESALGHGRKTPYLIEMANSKVARKVVVAAQPISKGDEFTEANITTKRWDSGETALRYFEFLGHKSDRAYTAEQPLVLPT